MALLGGCGGDGGSGSPPSSNGSALVGSGVESTNWCGYQMFGGLAGFRKVSGSWTVPAVEASDTNTASSMWVGIGGSCVNPPNCALVEPTLIQAGTEHDSTDGQPSYYAWWEALPAPAVQASGGPLSSETFEVRPGDQIMVDIDGSSEVLWSIKIANVRDGHPRWTFETLVPYVAAGFTAEWIVETPLVFGAGGVGQIPLSKFGRVSFSGLTQNGEKPTLTPEQRIVLTDGSGGVLANPSAPSSSGDGFDVCYGSAPC